MLLQFCLNSETNEEMRLTQELSLECLCRSEQTGAIRTFRQIVSNFGNFRIVSPKVISYKHKHRE